MSRAGAKHPYTPANADMMRSVSASNGNIAFAHGNRTMAAAVDTVATGLKTVIACGVSMEGDPDGVAFALVTAQVGNQAGAPAAGSIYIKSWKATGAALTTLIAATGFGQKINWWAIGTPVDEIDDAVA